MIANECQVDRNSLDLICGAFPSSEENDTFEDSSEGDTNCTPESQLSTSDRTLLSEVVVQLGKTRELLQLYERRANDLERLRSKLLGSFIFFVPPIEMQCLSAERDLKSLSSKLENERNLVSEVLSSLDGKIPMFFDSIFIKHFSTKFENLDVTHSGLFIVPLSSNHLKELAMKKGYRDSVSLFWARSKDGTLNLHDIHLNVDLSPLRLDHFFPFKNETFFGFTVDALNIYFMTIYPNGLVERHNVTVILYGMRVSGIKHGLENKTSSSRFEDDKPPVHVEAELLDSNNLCDTSRPNRESNSERHQCNETVGFVRFLKYRNTVILVIHVDRKLRIHHSDLSLWSSVPLFGPPTAVATNNNQIAYSIGSQIIITYPGYLGDQYNMKVCDVRQETNITSLAFDNLLPGLLHVGTDDGEVVTFHTRAPPSEASKGGDCRIIRKLKIGATLEMFASTPNVVVNNYNDAVIVQTAPGYIVVGMRNSVIVYNTSRSERAHPKFVSIHKIDTSYGIKQFNSKPAFVEASRFGAGLTSTQYWLITGPSNDPGSRSVFEIISPLERETLDVIWVKPVLIFGLFFVMLLWKIYKIRLRRMEAFGDLKTVRGHANYSRKNPRERELFSQGCTNRDIEFISQRVSNWRSRKLSQNGTRKNKSC